MRDAGTPSDMEIKVSLSLPHDEISIPVIRRICTQSLKVLGVNKECIDDVEIALTEACDNVLLHAHAGDEYEVFVGVDNEVAVIEVSDRGDGFDSADELDRTARQNGDSPRPDNVPEQGRGIFLMRALMDRVQFHQVDSPHRGTRVHLEKTLTWEESAPGARLSRARTGLRPASRPEVAEGIHPV
ncbi:anti-sigma regulatory factor (Ser/Thr protein kinase) [Frankia casuarinae]|nr:MULTISPECIES: ATP-binding protein [Frankia]ETA02651.1 anti-sigma regulatory factor (Ser/Thr protein kinase) [Frankia sp. CcI6]KFB06993.1 anti-sigma regulatory factor (Ser/Thr protein kinase) [Frankia sp. Allo2]EYT93038.1 anti-sigma regulatory factor (Ser/Thr protein kinase) [Frankia casuarinae]KDA44138.1 anti-sigma regulatory factor (Ser/Thr protein kinase) [Frankia sp. BMG5.23]KEZ37848.1 anti-sigma regulatory factor (Ser/Thr protein kinase) [Frankia sp. CeD]